MIKQALLDTDLMPWGKHKGIPMSDVPADYLHWIWTQNDGLAPKDNPVLEYIRRNLSSLKAEYKDGIWQ